MPFYFENLAYFVPSTETKKINGFAPIHPRLVPSLALSVPKPLKVPSLARSVSKPLKVPSLVVNDDEMMK